MLTNIKAQLKMINKELKRLDTPLVIDKEIFEYKLRLIENKELMEQMIADDKKREKEEKKKNMDE